MTSPDPTSPVHVFFVLDRSGSMHAIRSDVIGGFNAFVAEQRKQPGECLMTLVLFDSRDPHEVVLDAQPLAEVPELDDSTFVPRATTPLYDAMGHVIADATNRAEKRAEAGEVAEEVIFVTFTDGLENASLEYDRKKVFALIQRGEQRGWTFVYLGANQDAYREGGEIGYRAGSTQGYTSDAEGTRMALGSVSASLTRRRSRIRDGQAFDPADFFEGDKPAEDDERNRDG